MQVGDTFREDRIKIILVCPDDERWGIGERRTDQKLFLIHYGCVGPTSLDQIFCISFVESRQRKCHCKAKIPKSLIALYKLVTL